MREMTQPTKVGVFLNGDFREDPFLGAVFSGLGAIGLQPVQINPNVWSGEEIETFRFVITGIMKNAALNIRNHFAKLGVSTLIIEVAYSDRSNYGSMKEKKVLSWDTLNNIMLFDAPRDRPLLPVRDRKSGNGPILICSQKFNDGAHFMTEEQTKNYVKTVFKTIRSRTNRRIVHRPHPANVWFCDYIENQNTKQIPINDALDMADILITYNSTTGLQALAKGLSVFCSPCAHYSHLCDTDLRDIGSPRWIPVEEIKDYMFNLGYHEYSLEEIATGSPFTFMLNGKEGIFPSREI